MSTITTTSKRRDWFWVVKVETRPRVRAMLIGIGLGASILSLITYWVLTWL